jgi:hypothetical protein
MPQSNAMRAFLRDAKKQRVSMKVHAQLQVRRYKKQRYKDREITEVESLAQPLGMFLHGKDGSAFAIMLGSFFQGAWW